MAKTVGPLMSLDASGSVAGTLTFSKWKGRGYVRQLVTPANPQSAAQTAQRAMMRFLSRAWKDSAVTQSDWDNLAKQDNVSSFNAFTKYNLNLWTQVKGPVVNPLGAIPNTQPVRATATTTGGVRQINWSQVLTTHNDGWGVLLQVLPHVGSFTTVKSGLQQIVDIAGNSDGDTISAVLSGLDPGSYDLVSRAFAYDGTFGSASATISSIVVT